MVIASSVGVQDIGPVNALRLEVVVEDSRLVPGLVGVVEVVGVGSVLEGRTAITTVTWMIVMMEAVMGTVTVLTGTVGTVVFVIAMPMIDIHLLVIEFMVIDMLWGQIVTLKMDMARKEVTIGMDHGVAAAMTDMHQGAVAVTDMAVVDLHVMRGVVVIGTDLGLTIVPAGADAHHPMMIATNALVAVKAVTPGAFELLWVTFMDDTILGIVIWLCL